MLLIYFLNYTQKEYKMSINIAFYQAQNDKVAQRNATKDRWSADFNKTKNVFVQHLADGIVSKVMNEYLDIRGNANLFDFDIDSKSIYQAVIHFDLASLDHTRTIVMLSKTPKPNDAESSSIKTPLAAVSTSSESTPIEPSDQIDADNVAIIPSFIMERHDQRGEVEDHQEVTLCQGSSDGLVDKMEILGQEISHLVQTKLNKQLQVPTLNNPTSAAARKDIAVAAQPDPHYQKVNFKVEWYGKDGKSASSSSFSFASVSSERKNQLIIELWPEKIQATTPGARGIAKDDAVRKKIRFPIKLITLLALALIIMIGTRLLGAVRSLANSRVLVR